MSMKRTATTLAIGTCLGLSLPLMSLANPPVAPAAPPAPAVPGASQAVHPVAPPTVQLAPPAPIRAGEQQAYLGVVISPVPGALAAQLPSTVPAGQGVMVRRVETGSPAEKAGIKSYDILLSYDDQKLFSPAQLTGLVRADKPGRVVKLQLMRRGQLHEISAALSGRAQDWGEPLSMHDLFLSHPRPGMMNRPERHEQSAEWREFDALNLQRLSDGRYKASVDYLNGKGEKRHLQFQGSRDEIRDQIEGRTDIPVGERRQILGALNLNETPWPMYAPYPWRDFWGPGFWGDDWPY
jgi:hypothetical protein